MLNADALAEVQLKRTLFVLAALALAGCQSAADKQREAQAQWDAQERSDAQRCINYGFSRGTQDFAQCRMMIDQQRQASNDAMRNALIMNYFGKR